MMLSKTSKILVCGHRGLVGSALVRRLNATGYNNITTYSRQELDLTDSERVKTVFEKEAFDVVFLAAARVGGIQANNTFRAEFIHDNLAIENSVLWASHLTDVKHAVFLGSSCIYPRLAEQPMREEALLTGPLEMTNRPYAIAKIAGLELVDSLRRQFQRDYVSVMPTNLYGPGDNFDLENAHVMPALIRRFIAARDSKEPHVKVWGSGKPKREFLYVDDCADAIIFVAENMESLSFPETWSHINIGSNQEVSITELATLIANVVDFKGELVFDTSKPDGTPRKLLDSSRLHRLGWKAVTSLKEGVEKTVAWFEKQPKDSVRT